jgi:serine/threonine protein kinase
MGMVFKALDTSLQRIVALKVLSPRLTSCARSRKRFIREAQAAAAVSHDNVVAIHAVEEAGPNPYLVMQFVSGMSLEECSRKKGPLDVKEILRIGMQIAAGLAAAHAQGIIHRDIKPANILLENGVQRVKITDFGLACTVDDASLKVGDVVGTPLYMAPEQVRGEPFDHRADLFSLGSVMYTLCTGQPAFRAPDAAGVLQRVCEDTPRPIRASNPDIPEWLVGIVGRLLQKDPVLRFQSAAEVSDLLVRYLALVQQPWLLERKGRSDLMAMGT